MRHDTKILAGLLTLTVLAGWTVSVRAAEHLGYIDNDLSAPTSISVSTDRLAVLEPFAKQIRVFAISGEIRQKINIQGDATALQPLTTSLYLFCDLTESRVTAIDFNNGSQRDYFDGLFSFGKPTDLCVTSDRIYVLDAANSEIVEFTRDRQFLRRLTVTDSDGSPAAHASAFARNQTTGTFYVLDQVTSRVFVVTADGSHLPVFGSYGSGNGEITRGGSIVCAPDGKICVADRFQNRIAVFSSSGRFLENIDLASTNRPRLATPTGITIDRDGVMYVASTEGAAIEMFLVSTSSQTAFTCANHYPQSLDTISATGAELIALIETTGDLSGAVVDFELYEVDDLEQPIKTANGVAPEDSESAEVTLARWKISEPLKPESEYAWRARVNIDDLTGNWTELDRFFTGTLPLSYHLEQNYPNPFNPSTRIALTLAHASDVKLVIYNLLGRQVKVLADEPMEAGRHEVDWDGTTDAGSRASSGVYFYRLEAGDFGMTRKMILLK